MSPTEPGRFLVLLVVVSCGRENFDAVSAPDAADEVVGAARCHGLPATCGSTHDRSCCANEIVPSGTYLRGFDVAVDGAHVTAAPATTSDFRLDSFEVTVGRFRQFVREGKGTQANPPADRGGWESAWIAMLPADTVALVAALDCGGSYTTWTDAPAEHENRPITCISWYEAMAFCIWDGGSLPTEAQWHNAASGGSLQRAFPWSSPASSLALDCTRANHGWRSCNGATIDVGSTPAGNGLWGHADLAGNVWEWVLDEVGPYPEPCTDCANHGPVEQRVARGGGFFFGAADVRTAHRGGALARTRDLDRGVRCARAL